MSDVLVNAVAPGPIDTPTLSVENLSEDVLLAETQIPLRRVGCPEEVAAAVLFLLSLGGKFFDRPDARAEWRRSNGLVRLNHQNVGIVNDQ